MPWFQDFVGAVELARRQSRAAGQADPVMQFVTALDRGDTKVLETAWPGEVVVYDPRAGEVRGHGHLRQFVKNSQSLLAEVDAKVEQVASTAAAPRAVVELLVHLTIDGKQVAWPVAVVAESPDDRSVVFRTYSSQFPVAGAHQVRSAVLAPDGAQPGDVVGRYHAALAAGDTDAIVGTFALDGYYREPIGPDATHRGADELRSFFAQYFSPGGGVTLECCAVTDDGVRCAVEYNFVRWGTHDVPPQAGVVVHERGPDGLLIAVRVYDDVEPPSN